MELYKKGLEPWVGESPKILILGTLPSDESIKQQSYYANISKNSFWKIMRAILPENKCQYRDNKKFIISNKIALWDCLELAYREGSLDRRIDISSSVCNDLYSFLKKYPTIRTIVLNGKGKGSKNRPSTPYVFRKFFFEDTHCQIIKLPSTSNSCFDKEKAQKWYVINDLLK